jgi:membrane associated rhomboid family serine protease
MLVPCIPWSTDAPLEHRPWGTFALVAANIALYSFGIDQAIAALPAVDPGGWPLRIGFLNPLVWLTADVHQGDWLRFLMGMMFLWTFGLVVEGKLGWRRFVPIYLLIGLAQVGLLHLLRGSIDQIEPTYTLATLDLAGIVGSTAALYALAAMALVWSPKNDVRCVSWIWLRGYHYEISVTALLCMLVGCDAFFAATSGRFAPIATAAGAGFAVGFVIASLMLLAGRVDCQGWDLYSAVAGRTGDVDLDEMRRYQERPDEQSGLEEDYIARRYRTAMELMRTNLASRDATAAFELHQRMSVKLKDWRLPQRELIDLVQLLNERRSFPASIPLMYEFIRRFPGEAGPMRLELADILLHEENRPGKALGLLERTTSDTLPGELLPRREDLLREAQNRATGEIELEEDL